MRQPVKTVFNVLVADDSDADRELLRIALREAPRLRLAVEVASGDAVVAYFEGGEKYSNRRKFPLPDLLLLDLRMPEPDGFEVLEWLRDREFNQMTVVVLTGSVNPEDIKRALDLGADLFQVKPQAHADRIAMVLALEQHLLVVNGALDSRPERLRAARLSA